MKAAVALMFAVASAWAAPPPCSPSVHPVKFENAYVRICDATITPGTPEPVHTHSDDVVMITLQAQPTKEDMLGGPPPQRVMTNDGDISAIEILKPYTHSAVNTGSGDFRLLVIELKKPRTNAAGTTKPTGGALLENSRARVFRYLLQPGQTAAMHTHHRPYLIITPQAMDLSMTDPQGKNFTHPVAAGDFHFQQTPVTHDLKNAGKTPGEVVEVELK